MSQVNNLDFYRRREATERLLAGRAADPIVRSIHEQLANEYAKKVNPPEPILRIVT